MVAGVRVPSFDRETAERRFWYSLEDWRGLLSRDVESGCDVLRALLIGPLRFTPVVGERRRGYPEGAITLDRLVPGVIALPPCSACMCGRSEGARERP